MTSLPNIAREDCIATNHSCGQFQAGSSVEEAIGAVACCQSMEGDALKSDRQVEQVFVLLVPSFPARPKQLQLLFALIQSFIDVRFDLLN